MHAIHRRIDVDRKKPNLSYVTAQQAPLKPEAGLPHSLLDLDTSYKHIHTCISRCISRFMYDYIHAGARHAFAPPACVTFSEDLVACLARLLDCNCPGSAKIILTGKLSRPYWLPLFTESSSRNPNCNR